MTIEKINSILTVILASSVMASIISSIFTIANSSLNFRRENRIREKEELKKIYMEQLNPLRLYLIENHFRILVILRNISKCEENKCNDLLCIKTSNEILSKDDLWFNNNGCFLMSSCYLTSCLFAYLNKARTNIPLFKFSKEEDTKLMELITKVSLGFLENLGVFYVTQFSIGNDIFNLNENRIISYREFCILIKDKDMFSWFHRLIEYYLVTGNGENLDRVKHALIAMEDFIKFLDEKVGTNNSLQDRYKIENGGIELYNSRFQLEL